MFVRVDPSSGVPIIRQLCDQIRRHCVNGTLKPGDRLPSVRELARTLAVNQNTILHVYERLTGEELLERRQGDGTYVADRLPAQSGRQQRDSVMQEMDRVAHMAISSGISRQEAKRMFHEALSNIATQQLLQKAGAS